MNDELMHNLLKQLSDQDRVILADMWESDIRGVLEKLFGQRQLQLAQITLKNSPNHEFTVEQRGRASELTYITFLLKDNLKKVNNERAKRAKPE